MSTKTTQETELHMCLKAPTDFLAWRNLKQGQSCKYCGYTPSQTKPQ